MSVSADIAELEMPLVLCHPDLRRTARVQAFMQEIGEVVEARLDASRP